MSYAATAELRKLVQDLSYATGEGIEKAAAEVIRDTARRTQELAQAMAPRKTGKLANSIQVRIVNPKTAIIGPTAIYGVYQEFGTGTRGEFGGAVYLIKPRNKPYLVFKTRDGKTVRTKLVKHPGIKPHPFMRPALEQALGSAADGLAEAGDLLITRGPKA